MVRPCSLNLRKRVRFSRHPIASRAECRRVLGICHPLAIDGNTRIPRKSLTLVSVGPVMI
jgi:hypothetical protein